MKENNPSVLFISTVDHDDGDGDKKHIDIELKLQETNDRPRDLDKVSFSNKISIDSTIFNANCKKIANVATKVAIMCVKNNITFSGDGEGGKLTISHTDDKCNPDDPENKNTNDIIAGTYDVKHLLGFSKCKKICDSLDIYFKDKYPLVLLLPVSGLGKLYVFIISTDNK